MHKQLFCIVKLMYLSIIQLFAAANRLLFIKKQIINFISIKLL